MREAHPAAVGDVRRERLHALVLRLVVLAVEEQGRDLDVVQTVDVGPALQRTGDEELRGAVPARFPFLSLWTQGEVWEKGGMCLT